MLHLGIAYKKNVDDMRESPGAPLHRAYRGAGRGHRVLRPVRAIARRAGRAPWSDDLASHYDAVLIVTDHDSVDYRAIVDSAALVLDTRNSCRRAGIQSPKLVLA